jgi:hypothetical protein
VSANTFALTDGAFPASATLNPGSTWTINTDTAAAGGDTLHARNFVVRNTRDAAEEITVSCDPSANWTIGAAAATNIFMFGVNTDNSATYSSMHAGGVVINAALGSNTTQTFDLRFKAPSIVTRAGVEETIPVTVTASP